MIDIPALRRMLEEATAPPWRSMRDGNQYIETRYMPTAKCVGASRLEGPPRPWNPHAYIAFGFKAEQHEIARFIDADADLICALRNAAADLLDELERLREELASERERCARAVEQFGDMLAPGCDEASGEREAFLGIVANFAAYVRSETTDGERKAGG